MDSGHLNAKVTSRAAGVLANSALAARQVIGTQTRLRGHLLTDGHVVVS